MTPRRWNVLEWSLIISSWGILGSILIALLLELR